MEERQIFNAYDPIKYLYEDLEYPINQLKKYFKNEDASVLNDKGAYIFIFFIEKKIEELKSITIEIDDEYNKK